MLKLSHDAAKILSEARSRAEVPNTYGLRLFSEPTAGGNNLSIAFAPEPEKGDVVSEQDGIPVFVAPELATPLDDATLDVEQSADGVSLVIKMEAEDGELPDDGAARDDGM